MDTLDERRIVGRCRVAASTAANLIDGHSFLEVDDDDLRKDAASTAANLIDGH